MSKYVEELKTYIFDNIDSSGKFTKTYSQISKDLNINQNLIRSAMLQIIKQGLLSVETPPQKGRNSAPVWNIKTKLDPTHTEKDLLTIEFEGYPLQLVQTDIGLAINKNSLAITTLTDVTIIDKIMDSNAELFKLGETVTIIDGEMYFNKHSIAMFLMKLNLDNCLEIKRLVLQKFQQLIVNKMCETVLNGKLVITEDQHIKIRNNLSCLTELDKEMVSKVFYDLEGQIESLVNSISLKVTKQSQQISKLEHKVSHLENRVAQEKRAKDLAITEARECKEKLLERN